MNAGTRTLHLTLDRPHVGLQARPRQDTARRRDAPLVLLMRLSERMSGSGNQYLSGFLGAARVVAFKSKEPDKWGNSQWEVFVSNPEPKGDEPRPREGYAGGARAREPGA